MLTTLSYTLPWKSKTKHSMVFWMIHVKDSLLPKGNGWSLDFRGVVNLERFTPKQKDVIFKNAVCTHSRLPRGRYQSWKCNANNETTSSSLLFGKGCKGQTKNYGEVFVCTCIRAHISNHINESKDFLVNNRMMHFVSFIHRRIVFGIDTKACFAWKGNAATNYESKPIRPIRPYF